MNVNDMVSVLFASMAAVCMAVEAAALEEGYLVEVSAGEKPILLYEKEYMRECLFADAWHANRGRGVDSQQFDKDVAEKLANDARGRFTWLDFGANFCVQCAADAPADVQAGDHGVAVSQDNAAKIPVKVSRVADGRIFITTDVESGKFAELMTGADGKPKRPYFTTLSLVSTNDIAVRLGTLVDSGKLEKAIKEIRDIYARVPDGSPWKGFLMERYCAEPRFFPECVVTNSVGIGVTFHLDVNGKRWGAENRAGGEFPLAAGSGWANNVKIADFVKHSGEDEIRLKAKFSLPGGCDECGSSESEKVFRRFELARKLDLSPDGGKFPNDTNCVVKIDVELDGGALPKVEFISTDRKIVKEVTQIGDVGTWKFFVPPHVAGVAMVSREGYEPREENVPGLHIGKSVHPFGGTVKLERLPPPVVQKKEEAPAPTAKIKGKNHPADDGQAAMNPEQSAAQPPAPTPQTAEPTTQTAEPTLQPSASVEQPSASVEQPSASAAQTAETTTPTTEPTPQPSAPGEQPAVDPGQPGTPAEQSLLPEESGQASVPDAMFVEPGQPACDGGDARFIPPITQDGKPLRMPEVDEVKDVAKHWHESVLEYNENLQGKTNWKKERVNSNIEKELWNFLRDRETPVIVICDHIRRCEDVECPCRLSWELSPELHCYDKDDLRKRTLEVFFRSCGMDGKYLERTIRIFAEAWRSVEVARNGEYDEKEYRGFLGEIIKKVDNASGPASDGGGH